MSPPIPGEQTARGYEPPINTQFSAFLDNRVGKLAELIEIFDGQSIQVVALSIVDSTDHAVVRLVTTDGHKARHLLRKHHIPYSEADILVVELGVGQTLTTMCRHLLAAEINIQYAFSLWVRPHGTATIALHTDDQILASQILQRKGFSLLGENDLTDYPDMGDTYGHEDN